MSAVGGSLINPPPWPAVYHLINQALVLYIALIALALARAVLNPLFDSSASANLAYDQDKLGRWLKAIGGTLGDVNPAFSVARVVLSTILCILYVVTTYMERIPLAIHVIQAVCGVIFLVRMIMRLLVVSTPLSLVLRPIAIIESLSVTSLILARHNIWLHLGFLQALAVLWHWENVKNASKIVIFESTVARKLANILLKFVVFIYVFACGFQLFELLGDPHDVLRSSRFDLTVANAFYFCVVTIFTVGYGDFVPVTLFGRVWIVLVILFGAYLVARQVSQVIDVIGSLRRGMGSFVKAEGAEHIVVCGNIKFTHLRSFVAEFYTVPANRDTRIVVMTSSPEWTEDQWNTYFGSGVYKSLVVYLEGRLTVKEDLARAQVDTASAAFVMSRNCANDPFLEDTETLKRILMLRTYGPSLPIYAMCALKDSMLQFYFALEHVSDDYQGYSQSDLYDVLGDGNEQNNSFNDDFGNFDEDDDYMLVTGYDGSSDVKSEALCLQDFEASLLAESIFCHGLSTLLSNLLLRIRPETKATDSPWMAEYKVGAECRLETIKLPSPLWGKTLKETMLYFYDHGVMVIAVKKRADRRWRPATLETTIQLNMIGLAITYHNPGNLEQVIDHVALHVKGLDHTGGSTHTDDRTEEFVETGGNGGPGGAGRHTRTHSIDEDEVPILSSTPVVTNDALSAFLEDDDASPTSPKNSNAQSHESQSQAAAPRPSSRIPVSPPIRNRANRFAMSQQSPRARTPDDNRGQLRDHIIVCLIGRAGIHHLRHFIDHVLCRNGTKPHSVPQIVVVGSHITQDEEQALLRRNNRAIANIVRGPCMSAKLLKSANCKRARAVVVLTCEDSGNAELETADSKTIFTLMILDHVLGDRSAVFVCSTLDAEQSMKLLWAPGCQRRLGVSPHTRRSIPRMSSYHSVYGNRRVGSFAKRISSFSLSHGFLSPQSSARSSSSNFQTSMSNMWEPSFAAGLSQNLQRSLTVSFQGEESKRRTAEKVGRLVRSREHIYERQRYASGELLISTLHAALLIREHAVPGLMSILTTLFGAHTGKQVEGEDGECSQCWIRLIKVSEHWVRRENRERIYREVVLRLLQFGCIPLGLYRTGTVPIRIEVEENNIPSASQHEGENDELLKGGDFTDNAYGSLGNSEQAELDVEETEDKDYYQINLSRKDDGGNTAPARCREYVCPTTKHHQVFEQLDSGGGNNLPYVYTFPESFTLVNETDSVYVLAHPELHIPKVW